MTRRVGVYRLGARCGRAEDLVAVEEPLEVRIGPVPVVVTMRTPGHDFELATGMLITEGVVPEAADVVSVRYCESVEEASAGNVVVVGVPRATQIDLAPMKRAFHVSSSCGVCGKAGIDQLRVSADAVADGFTVDVGVLLGLPETMRAGQSVFDATGGLHAAALFDGDGALVCLREDIGRHNAVDKVIGWAALDGRWPLDDHVLMVSGRSSFEIVQKAIKARLPVIAAVSAASSLAIELASAYNQTLVGFMRSGGMVIYCGDERVRRVST